ncbi:MULTISPECIES: phasin family protein [unclassified Roseitalea]|uniref:phasin family protein n=1 Tax=unclassified Roseitalea TaxID=2639107 RepID=UPI00273D6AC5|nr:MULTISPECIES: phasin family protein [unclassified Roseitalea]
MAKTTQTKPDPATSAAEQAADDAFAMAQMGNPAEYVERFRAMAEDNMEKSRAAFDKARSVYEDLQKEAETGLHSAQAHSSKITLAAIDTMRANTETTFGHMQKLMGVKSMAELVELQSAFVRQQAEMAVDTAKTMQGLYQKAGEDMTAPAKAAAEKAMGALKTQ